MVSRILPLGVTAHTGADIGALENRDRAGGQQKTEYNKGPGARRLQEAGKIVGGRPYLEYALG